MSRIRRICCSFICNDAGIIPPLPRNGANALNLSFERRADLVILDLMLPKVHGFEVCRILKASPSTRHIPVLMLTAAASTENKCKVSALARTTI